MWYNLKVLMVEDLLIKGNWVYFFSIVLLGKSYISKKSKFTRIIENVNDGSVDRWA